MITDLTGSQITDFDFSYDDETEVDASCSVLWQNENFVFGGWNKKRQIAKLDGCRLRHIGELTFDHVYAGCANDKNEKILLCFNFRSDEDSSEGDKCRSLSSPTGPYEDVPRSNYTHRETKIAASDSKLFCSKQKFIFQVLYLLSVELVQAIRKRSYLKQQPAPGSS